MPRHFQREMLFDVPPARLVALMTDPAFLEADGRQQGQTWVKVTDLERTDRRVRLRIDQRGPNRDPRALGKEAAQALFYDWDLATASCTWRREPEKPDGVDVRGAHQARPEGHGCRYRMSWDVDVSVPLVGRVFEKKLEEGILEAMGSRERLMRQWLAP